MAQLTFPITPVGLAVPLFIGLDGNTTTAIRNAGLPVPAPVLCRGLLDTGTSVTSVASVVLQRLGQTPVGAGISQTAGAALPVRLFTVSLSITDPSQSSSPWLTEPDLLVTELPASLDDTDVLVGLDVLLQRRLLLDGPARSFALEI
jgi:hypothetical protein